MVKPKIDDEATINSWSNVTIAKCIPVYLCMPGALKWKLINTVLILATHPYRQGNRNGHLWIGILERSGRDIRIIEE